MKNVLILYGWQGSDAPHWQDWLYHALKQRGYNVSFPQLSDNQRPDKEIWMREAKEAFDTVQPQIVITHSMGNTLWFHLCNAGLVGEVEQLLMVAPPRDLSEFEAVKSFFPVEYPKDLHAKHKILVCSDNDPYMSLEESHALAKRLDTELLILENAGHINSESGYGAWPWALEWVCDHI